VDNQDNYKVDIEPAGANRAPPSRGKPSGRRLKKAVPN